MGVSVCGPEHPGLRSPATRATRSRDLTSSAPSGCPAVITCRPRSSQILCGATCSGGQGSVHIWSSRIGLKDTLDPGVHRVADRLAARRAARFRHPVRHVQGDRQSRRDQVHGAPRRRRAPRRAARRPGQRDVQAAVHEGRAVRARPSSRLMVVEHARARQRSAQRARDRHRRRGQRRADPTPTPSWPGTAGSPTARTRAGRRSSTRGSKSSRAHRTSATVALPAAPDDRGPAHAPRTGSRSPPPCSIVAATALRPASAHEGDRHRGDRSPGAIQVPAAARVVARRSASGTGRSTLDDAPAAAAALNLNVKAALSLTVTPNAHPQRPRRHLQGAASRGGP